MLLFVCLFLLVLNIGHHIDTCLMAPALKRSTEEAVEHILCQAGADDAGTHAQHICIIVYTCESCGIGVGADCGTHAVELVGTHAHADACAADQDAECTIGVCLYLLADSGGEDGIVAGFCGMTAHVVDGVAESNKMRFHLFFHRVSCGVSADINDSLFHVFYLFPLFFTSFAWRGDPALLAEVSGRQA